MQRPFDQYQDATDWAGTLTTAPKANGNCIIEMADAKKVAA